MFGETERLAEGRVGDAFFRGRTSGWASARPDPGPRRRRCGLAGAPRRSGPATIRGALEQPRGEEVGGRRLSSCARRSPIAVWRRLRQRHARSSSNRLKNPYFLGDDVALTQTFGWVGAWTSSPSAYAVAARNTADVVAAVNFAREHRLRLVVKGGGHSYQGTSNAADSLLVWTRRMNAITLHDAFVPQGCAGSGRRSARSRSAPARSGRMSTTRSRRKAGGYVQGGGCMTVGVAGLVQSGGFGSFSKRCGLAAAACSRPRSSPPTARCASPTPAANPELFWALKGGGGGSFGVVTRLTCACTRCPRTSAR